MEHTSAQFAAGDGLLLTRQAWRPAGAPSAVLAVVHGYGEHGGRGALEAPRLARQQKTVGGRELHGGVFHGRPQRLRAARSDEEMAVRPPSSSSGSGQP